MTTTTTPPAARSPLSTTPARDGFAQVLRAEWTKFRSVRSTAWCLVLAVVLTALLSVLGAKGSSTNVNEAPPADQLSFVHRPMSGDGTVTVHVRAQRDSQEWARAGIMIKQRARSGSPYAAMMVTPRHGVRMQANFKADIAGGGHGAPRWLRLTRAGTAIAGYESADGRTWKRLGTATLAGLPPTVEVGMFVDSPANPVVERRVGGSTISRTVPTSGAATFDNVAVAPVAGTSGAPTGTAGAGWTHDAIDPGSGGTKGSSFVPPRGVYHPATGGFTESAGTFTVTGSGDVGPAKGDDDLVQNSLSGLLIGLIAVIALGVLFATSEYKTGLIRTTFTASPRRGRVLAAKAIVLGGAAFAVGLVAAAAAFALAQPQLRANGYEPPGYPALSPADGTVLRAVIGAAGCLAVLALFGLGVGAALRRTAGAVAVVIGLVLVPQILAPLLTSLTAAQWLQRLTPTAGLAVTQTVHRYDTAIAPLAGFGVLCAYAAVALGGAYWRMRRLDA